MQSVASCTSSAIAPATDMLSLPSALAAAAAPELLPCWKQAVKQGRHSKHCRMLLAKHVLPRLCRPTTPCNGTQPRRMMSYCTFTNTPIPCLSKHPHGTGRSYMRTRGLKPCSGNDHRLQCQRWRRGSGRQAAPEQRLCAGACRQLRCSRDASLRATGLRGCTSSLPGGCLGKLQGLRCVAAAGQAWELWQRHLHCIPGGATVAQPQAECISPKPAATAAASAAATAGPAAAAAAGLINFSKACAFVTRAVIQPVAG